MKTRLLVVPNFKSFKKGVNEDGGYTLVHPQFYVEHGNTLFGHWCSSLGWAFQDLQYPNRHDFLDTIFGVDGWEFEFLEWSEAFDDDMKNFDNPKIDTSEIIKLFEEYKTTGKHL